MVILLHTSEMSTVNSIQNINLIKVVNTQRLLNYQRGNHCKILIKKFFLVGQALKNNLLLHDGSI